MRNNPRSPEHTADRGEAPSRGARGFVSGALLAAMVAAPAVALAHIPTAEVILSSAARKREAMAVDVLVAHGVLKRRGEAPREVWEALHWGKGHRVEQKGTAGTEVRLTAQGKLWRWSLGARPGPAAKSDADVLAAFLGGGGDTEGAGRRAARLLERLGVDTSVVSLSRQDGRIAYVIGAKPWEKDKPQLWLDKQYEVPIRILERDASGKLRETRFLGFGLPVGQDRFPERIEVRENGELLESTVYHRVELNPAVDLQIFAPPS